MSQYTCGPCGFSSQYKSSLINHMKSKKHLGGTVSPHASNGGGEVSPHASNGGGEVSPHASNGGGEVSPHASNGGGEVSPQTPHAGGSFIPIIYDVATDGSVPNIPSMFIPNTTHATQDVNDTAARFPPNIHLTPEEHGPAILFLEMKGKMQELRIAELEDVIHSLAADVAKLKETPVIDTQNNTTNNVNLMVQMSVDNDNKLGVVSGMGRVPNLPAVVREQLEHIIPLSINALFSKNQRLTDEGDESDKGILCQEVEEEEEEDSGWGEVDVEEVDQSEPTPNNIGKTFKDEDVREAMRKMLLGNGGSATLST